MSTESDDDYKNLDDILVANLKKANKSIMQAIKRLMELHEQMAFETVRAQSRIQDRQKLLEAIKNECNQPKAGE